MSKEHMKRAIWFIAVITMITIFGQYLYDQTVHKDDSIDILMIGNSFSYHFTDELYHIANAAGIKMNVYNVYYSGCSLEQHWLWWNQGEANYKLRIYNENGRKVLSDISLDQCLAKEDWDVITFQDSNKWIRESGTASALEHSEPYMGDLLTYVSNKFPDAEIYWHQTWAYQVGYNRNGFSISSHEEQKAYYGKIREVSLAICNKYDLPWIPSGDAWQIARENVEIGDTLCGKDGTISGDYYHDGNTGGGQYLNACVWFEVITGESCIGNSYRPTYEISEQKIIELQKSAHQAVREYF